FEFNLPRVLVGREQYSGDARLGFDINIRDTAGQEERRTISRLVTKQPLRVEVIPEGGSLVQGIANAIYLYVSYADGRPVPGARLIVYRGEKQQLVEKTVATNDLGVASFE